MGSVLARPRIPDPDPKYADEPNVSAAGELWKRDDSHIEPRVLLAIVNPIILETVGGKPAVGISLRQCEVLDLLRDLANEFHTAAHEASVFDPD